MTKVKEAPITDPYLQTMKSAFEWYSELKAKNNPNEMDLAVILKIEEAHKTIIIDAYYNTLFLNQITKIDNGEA